MNQDTVPPSRNRRIFSPWYYNKYFRYAIGLILLLTIVFLLHQISFLISPLINFFSTLFAPIAISFLFYYLLRPVVYFLEKYRVPRILSILSIYLILAVLFIIFLTYLVPLLGNQISAIANTSVKAIEDIQQTQRSISIGPFTFNLEKEIGERLVGFLQEATKLLSQNLFDLIGIITRVASILIVIPFILYYLLKEDHDFSTKFLLNVPGDFGKEVKKVLKHIDSALSSYITGLVLVSLSVGSMLFIGYLIIGLKYALILSAIAIIVMTVPYVGPFMAITPALLVGLSQSSFMVLKVAIVFVIVQQIESNLISPQIIGQRLNIHPLTMVLLLLAAGTLYGLVGLILATPLYAIFKVLVESAYKIYLLRYPKIQNKLSQH